MKKLTALLLCLLMMTSALAEIEWPPTLTNGQAALRNYVDEVNLTLTQQKAGVIDMAYEVYAAFASLGMNGEEAPETAEMQFLLGTDGMHSLVLRLCDADQFEQVAAACLMAASSQIKPEDAKAIVASYAKVMRADVQNRVSSSDAMTHSFEEDVIELQGDQPRAYFAYYPNQYGDGRSWLQRPPRPMPTRNTRATSPRTITTTLKYSPAPPRSPTPRRWNPEYGQLHSPRKNVVKPPAMEP